MLFGYIFINRIQPFEAANISAAFLHFKISFRTTFHALLLCIHISGIHCKSIQYMEEDIQNYSPTVMFRGTPVAVFSLYL